MIRIDDVSKTYRGASRKALDGVSIDIPRGSILGLLGPNGSGKTTLLSILVGLVQRDAGSVQINGLELDRDLSAIRALVGFVPQTLAFYPMLTVAENLRFYAGALGLTRAAAREQIPFVVQIAGLGSHLGNHAAALSGGLQRRLNLAVGLLNRPKVLFLDEPTVGIDPQSRTMILDSIMELGRSGVTIVYASHYMEEVERICDRIAIIDQGRILVLGALSELLYQHSQRGEVNFQFDGHLEQPLAAEFAAQYGATFPDARTMRVWADDPQTLIDAIVPVLHGRSANSLVSIQVGHRNLEDLFVSMTQRRLSQNT